MPELPEVEYAARVARAVAVGKTIASVRVLHAAARRRLPAREAATLSGDVVAAITRRGKHQLVALASGRTLHVHFRMTGEWVAGTSGETDAPHARVVIDFTDGRRLTLGDSRALATVTLHAAGSDPLPALGPEADDRAFDVPWLKAALAARRGPIKTVLLDQRVVAGIGNIYAAEALWQAEVDPRRAANRISAARLTKIVAGVRRVMSRALRGSGRYYRTDAAASRERSGGNRFNVYDREGQPCRRCTGTIRRVVQAGRSTYFCAKCQW